jgi:hypothetical protein
MKLLRKAILAGEVCPYCRRGTYLVDSSIIYSGKSYGPVYICGSCDAYVGVYKGTKRALGRLANQELRYWKKEAHAEFDPLWHFISEERGVSLNEARSMCYKWLSDKMGTPLDETHIGMFDVDECKRVIQFCRPVLKKIKERGRNA